MEAAQLLFEVVGRDRSTDVEFERCSEDTRRHRPVPTLEFSGDDAVEVHHPSGAGGQECDAPNEEREAPARRPGAGHAACP
jgi:hypothetical protein